MRHRIKRNFYDFMHIVRASSCLDHPRTQVSECTYLMTSKIVVSHEVPDVCVSVVPFSIQYTGNAETAKYFTPSKVTEKQRGREVETAQFRGLKLAGETLELENKVGHILKCSEFLYHDESEVSDKITTAKQYSGVAKFHNLTVYGHDGPAPLNSKWKLIQEWEKIADVIHS